MYDFYMYSKKFKKIVWALKKMIKKFRGKNYVKNAKRKWNQLSVILEKNLKKNWEKKLSIKNVVKKK